MAEALQTIAKEKYGSCKHLSAITHGLNKHLTFDLIHLKKRPGHFVLKNAKECYNSL